MWGTQAPASVDRGSRGGRLVRVVAWTLGLTQRGVDQAFESLAAYVPAGHQPVEDQAVDATRMILRHHAWTPPSLS